MSKKENKLLKEIKSLLNKKIKLESELNDKISEYNSVNKKKLLVCSHCGMLVEDHCNLCYKGGFQDWFEK